MLFADDPANISFWVTAVRDFGALGILLLLVYQLQPLIKLLLDHQSTNAALDRAARQSASTTFGEAITEAYQTMRAEGKENREVWAREFAGLRADIKGACLFQHPHQQQQRG